jgi:glycosyltransferase involved in cell wall biosynthesis
MTKPRTERTSQDRRPQKTAVFVAHKPEDPSFRHRQAAAFPFLVERGWRCVIDELPRKRNYFGRFVRRRRLYGTAEVVVAHSVKLAPLETLALSGIRTPWIFDLDDAIWLSRQQQTGDAPGRSRFREMKVRSMCRRSTLVVAGNRFIANFVKPASRRVEIVPTSVDSPYPPPEVERDQAVVVWIGLPGNLIYLEPLRSTFAGLARAVPGFRLRIVSSAVPDWPDVPVEFVPWSTNVENHALRSAAVGIMPLPDDDFARGKCAFKLLQYMAVGLPTVASPVGMNRDVVNHGVSGFLATNPAEWSASLRHLLMSPGAAIRMGAAGRRTVLERFDRGIVMPRYARVIERVSHMGRETKAA